jgi:putative membrane protein (TIGR04086 family)
VNDAGNVSIVRWRTVLSGALVGLVLLVVVSVVEAILDNNLSDFDDSGWIYPLFVAVLVSYAVGGFVAGRAAPDAALTNGTLAGLGAFVLWIPVRILIWVARDEDKGLFSGHAPVLRPGQVFGHLVIAAALGMLGGWLGARAVTRARARTRTPGDPSAS